MKIFKFRSKKSQNPVNQIVSTIHNNSSKTIDPAKVKQLVDASLDKLLIFLDTAHMTLVKEHIYNDLLSHNANTPQADQTNTLAAVDLAGKGGLIRALIEALKQHGSPAEIIFISKASEGISLKTEKDLTDNDLANIILDNHPKH